MRILFLTAGLEPGRDGVGDYVRLLAQACAAAGHACAVAALHDPFIAEPIHSKLETQGEPISIIRLPANESWPRRIELTEQFRQQFRADRISFQVVPYAWEPRGVLSSLVGPLGRLTSGCPLHLMFHELWLGAGRPSPFRFYVMGWFQRRGIHRLLTELRPGLVTTSNPVYAAMLRSLGANAEVLPLFGNISITPFDLRSALSELPPASGITERNRGEWWIGLFFGALHEQWQAEPFMSRLLRAAQRAEKRVCLVLAGRTGSQGDILWNRLGHDYPQIAFSRVEEKPAEVISALLQLADFGVAASPWQLIGKSGTVAAMLDHGLPVIVTRDDFQPSFHADEPPSTDPLVHLDNAGLEAKLAAGLPRRTPRARVDEIAAQLCHQLKTLSPPAS